MGKVRALLAVALVAAAGCGGDEPALVLEVESPAGFESLQLSVKRYLGGDATELFAPVDVPAEPVGDRLRLLVELPARGRYAVHFVDVDDLWGVNAVTRCYDVQGVVVDRDVALSALDETLDADGDTFPDELEPYCRAREAAGLDCDLTCADDAFRALVDCDPAIDYDPGEGCGAVPPAAAWNPFVPDRCGDCHDVDCFAGDPPCSGEDGDGDGYVEGDDCDDDDPTVHPGAEEVCGNGVDDNCVIDLEGCVDGDLPCDADGDGHRERTSPTCGDDCDDSDPTAYPSADEFCDRVDNDCDGQIDEVCLPDDVDADGATAEEDCNDCDPGVRPGAVELCGNGIDEDCDGEDLTCPTGDGDRDGYASITAGGQDCDDEDARFHPEAPDRCGDGFAQDCVADLPCSTDADEDGFDPDVDCADDDPLRNPWAEEQCDADGLDEDCDGFVNEVLDPTGTRGCGYDPDSLDWFEILHLTDVRHCGGCRNDCETARTGDACVSGSCDCDGIGACAGGLAAACCPDDGRPARCADLTSDTADCGSCGRSCRPGETCDPTGPGGRGECHCAAEGGEPCPSDSCSRCCPSVGCIDGCTDVDHCGGCDVDCDAGAAPAGDRCVDGACRCGTEPGCTGTEWCTLLTEPPGETCGCADLLTDPLNCGECGLVCDDVEPCTEDSCVDGLCEYHTLDADDDGYCAAGCNDIHTGERGDCQNGDCNDSDPDIHPDADELCSTATVDDDCDGSTNDLNAVGCSDFMIDSDRDGFGETGTIHCICVAEAPYDATVGGDCADGSGTRYPGATERCNGLDDDCDGSTADDGDGVCPGLCCGPTPACRSCCSDADCVSPAVCDTTTTFTCI